MSCLRASVTIATKVAPLPDKVARKLYAEREADMDSIRRFIAAQPKDAQRRPGKSGPARSSDRILSYSPERSSRAWPLPASKPLSPRAFPG